MLLNFKVTSKRHKHTSGALAEERILSVVWHPDKHEMSLPRCVLYWISLISPNVPKTRETWPLNKCAKERGCFCPNPET